MKGSKVVVRIAAQASQAATRSAARSRRGGEATRKDCQEGPCGRAGWQARLCGGGVGGSEGGGKGAAPTIKPKPKKFKRATAQVTLPPAVVRKRSEAAIAKAKEAGRILY